MHRVRPPHPTLAPWVSQLFLRTGDGLTAPAQERTLPTGAMHCVFRLADPAIRVTDPDAPPQDVGHAVVAGARSRYYLRDLAPGRFVTVGAILKPGASRALFGTPADEVAGRHTPLEALWGADATAARDRLGEAGPGEALLSVLEQLLLARLRPHAVSPLVQLALARFEQTDDVGAVVRESGYSHRIFVQRFKAEVGLTPKRHCRVRRFHRALRALDQHRTASIAELAADCGYADQAHLDRDFREMAGLPPSAWRPAGGSNSSKPGRGRR